MILARLPDKIQIIYVCKELLGMTGINFSVMSIPVDESFPDSLQGTEISEYIVNISFLPFAMKSCQK